MQVSDQVLVEKVLEGENRAYDELLRGLEPQLKGFMAGQLAPRPEASVDEAMQELRIYLFRRLDRYDPQYPLIVFARALGKNVAKRFLYKKDGLVPLRGGDEDDSDWSDDLTPMELAPLPENLRAVLGENRFASPDGPPPPSRAFLELFELFLRYGGYPHQQVSFAYSILIWGKAKSKRSRGSGKEGRPALTAFGTGKVPVTGDPDRVVEEVGPRPLRTSCSDMMDEIRLGMALDDGFLTRAAGPLYSRLELTGSKLFSRDATSRRLFSSLEEQLIGDTRLREYFGKDQRKSISDWTRTVKERVKKAFLDPSSRKRIPLPQ